MTPAATSGTPSAGLDDSPLIDDLGFLLARASATTQSRGNAALAAHDLRVRSYSVLALAVSEQHPSQRELADFLRLDPSQVVALIDDLARDGLVVRESDPRDRRANVVVATDAGRAAYTAARASARSAEEESLRPLSAAERVELARLLRMVAFPTEP
ncbi:MarR family winged helix-turn-helix transcriptional regulator [Microbacterium sp. MM2322]|uniref:MarR family winged helix-turn-helix transcriptional regulator n=1 Tax=Microbacterium sp. MM2322 TaxID=3157631 RepID=UPI0032D57CE1